MKRKMNELLALIGITFIVLVLSSCGKNTPDKTVNNYLSYLANGEYEESYSLLSLSDRKVKPCEKYVKDLTISQGIVTTLIFENMTYSILSSSITDKDAIVTLEVNVPDFSDIFRELFSLKNILDPDNIDEDFIKKLKNKKPTFNTIETTFNLVNEEGTWKILLGYEKKERIKQLEEKINSLYDNGSLEELLEANEELYILNENENVKETINDLKAKIEKENEKKAYISKVELYDFESHLYDSYFSDKVPGVEFKLKNHGDKELTMVEVTVYFQDENKVTIAETCFHPISKYGMSSQSLKPNYIWDIGEGMYFPAENVPSEWKEGNAYGKITDLAF